MKDNAVRLSEQYSFQVTLKVATRLKVYSRLVTICIISASVFDKHKSFTILTWLVGQEKLLERAPS